jgi:hypothetical protein
MADQLAEVIDVQTYLGQQYLNVTHWLDTTGALEIDALESDYVANIVPLMAAFQSTSLSHVAIRARQVYPDATLILETPISPPVAGTDGNTPADSYMAYSFKFQPSASTVVLQGGFTGHLKRSGMRVGGITLSDTGENNVPSGVVTLARTWSTEMLSTQGGGWILVVASFLDGARARQAEAQAYAIITAISDPGASTQNTRKVLRGRTS